MTGDAVIVIKTFDDLRNDKAVDDSTTEADITDFATTMSVPLIQTFTQESSSKIFKSPIQKHTLFFTDLSAAHHAPTMAAFTGAAAAFRGQTMMINVPHTEARVLEYFGITEKDLPIMVLGDMSGEGGQMKKYPFPGPMETSAITTFLTQALGGEIKPTLKSETPAPEDTAQPVKVIKGESFADIVLNNNNDVFVEFYAPWCGHCKKLSPIWDELAEKYKDVPTLTIAKMDATANEGACAFLFLRAHSSRRAAPTPRRLALTKPFRSPRARARAVDYEGVNVKGFPTLYFFPAGEAKKVVEYDGARDLGGLTAFLKKNVKTPFTLADSDDDEAGADDMHEL